MMNTQPNTTSQHFRAALESTALATRQYLEEAKRAGDPIRANSLEASAIELAIVADQLEAVAKRKFGLSLDRSDLSPAERLNLDQATKRMLRDCERLTRVCDDIDLRDLARDLKRSFGGLGEIPRSPFYFSDSSAISR